MEDAKLERYFELIQGQFELMQRQFDDLRTEMRAGFARIDARFEKADLEWNERFQSVLDRLDMLEKRVDKNIQVVGEIRSEIDTLKTAIYKLDNNVDEVHMSVNGLSDDMRQRFRALNDRVAAVEKRLAA